MKWLISGGIIGSVLLICLYGWQRLKNALLRSKLIKTESRLEISEKLLRVSKKANERKKFFDKQREIDRDLNSVDLSDPWAGVRREK